MSSQQRFHDAFVNTMLCFVRWSRSSRSTSAVRMEALDVERLTAALPFAKDQQHPAQQKTKDEQLAAFLTDLGISLTVAVLASVVLRYYSSRLLSHNNNDTEQRSRAAVQADLRKNTLAKERAAHNRVDWRHLSAYEIQVADGIVDPAQMDCSFADMGGMDEIKHKVFATVLAPLYRPDLYDSKSKLRTTPRGILFYGPPGTGKTMMVQCMATEAKAILIPLKGSTLLNKYWGESNKMVAAAFSLAHKLQPAILFIDELDNFLPRSGGGGTDTALMDSIKAEFLTLWEGIGTNAASKVLVVGATNRPERIDTAILRRMPCAIQLPLPNETSRLDILRKILKDEPCDGTVAEALPLVAAATQHYSGSDLHEVCKHAANISVQEITHEFARRRVMGEDVEPTTENEDTEPERVRPMRASDLWEGVKAIRPTGEAAARYGKERRAAEPDGLDERALAPLVRLLLQGLQQGSNGRRPTDENSDDVPTM